MFIHILANIGGDLLRTLEKTVVDSGYYLADGTDGNESYVIGLWNSFTDDIPVEKRISIATPDMKITSRGVNTFRSTKLRSVKKIQGRFITLEAFLSEQKKLTPLTISC